MVTLYGEIERTVKDELSEALLPYDGGTPPRTVVDLSGVTFMDSSGINVFSTPVRRPVTLRNRCCGSFSLSAWYQIIPCHLTVDQALAA